MCDFCRGHHVLSLSISTHNLHKRSIENSILLLTWEIPKKGSKYTPKKQIGANIWLIFVKIIFDVCVKVLFFFLIFSNWLQSFNFYFFPISLQSTVISTDRFCPICIWQGFLEAIIHFAKASTTRGLWYKKTKLTVPTPKFIFKTSDLSDEKVSICLTSGLFCVLHDS